MHAMPTTPRETFKSLLQSACRTLGDLGREMRNYFRIFNEGYRAKNCQWMQPSQTQRKKH